MDNRLGKISGIPEWMKNNENHVPKMGRDAFINKSILSLLSVISKIKAQDTRKQSKYEANIVVKVLFTFILVVMISVSRSFSFIAAIIVYLLIKLSFMEAKQIIQILKISLLMTGFTFIILLPAAIWGNSYSLVMIPAKVFATITAVNILSKATKWSNITKALKSACVPDLFILVLDITIKYILLLGELALQLLYALKLRSVGVNRSKQTSLAGISATVFMKSKEMAEEMYDAMQCRGFTGDYSTAEKFKWAAVDILYAAMNCAIIAVFIYTAFNEKL